jgi:hypothetical protein
MGLVLAARSGTMGSVLSGIKCAAIVVELDLSSLPLSILRSPSVLSLWHNASQGAWDHRRSSCLCSCKVQHAAYRSELFALGLRYCFHLLFLLHSLLAIYPRFLDRLPVSSPASIRLRFQPFFARLSVPSFLGLFRSLQFGLLVMIRTTSFTRGPRYRLLKRFFNCGYVTS